MVQNYVIPNFIFVQDDRFVNQNIKGETDHEDFKLLKFFSLKSFSTQSLMKEKRISDFK